MKWSKRIAVLMLSLVLILGMSPVQVFASVEEETIETTAPAETTVPAETTAPTVPAETTPPESDALTPEGNMTLVDDINSAKSGKEFITVVTKNGNYFYIIIDRDDEGNNTVHFLNLVEEEDLLELMSEEEAQTYLDNLETQATEPVDTTPTEPVQDIPEETEPEGNFELNMDNETMIMLAIPIVVLMAGGFAVYFVFSRKKPQKAPAETSGDDDDWDYDYEIPEEEDDAPDEDKY